MHECIHAQHLRNIYYTDMHTRTAPAEHILYKHAYTHSTCGTYIIPAEHILYLRNETKIARAGLEILPLRCLAIGVVGVSLVCVLSMCACARARAFALVRGREREESEGQRERETERGGEGGGERETERRREKRREKRRERRERRERGERREKGYREEGEETERDRERQREREHEDERTWLKAIAEVTYGFSVVQYCEKTEREARGVKRRREDALHIRSCGMISRIT